ncbi:MAG: tetratricopeptide repeat protein [Cyclobacteriaceae bacterium]|nr:tetratricopeptide repeat protein [Cyclobacteriaceae bacterium]
MKKGTLIFLLIVTSRILFAQQTASFLFNKGYNYLLADKNESIKYFTQSLEKDPEFSLAYFYRGMANYKLGNYSESINDFNEALSHDSNLIKCYMYMGFAEQQLNEPEKALAFFEKYIKHQANVSNTDHLVLAKAKQELGDMDGALKEYKLAMDEKPSEEQLYHLFLATYEKGDYKKALELINSILQLNPTFYGYYLHKGKVELNIKSFNNALQNFNVALGLNPEVADTYFLKANVLDTLDRYDEALTNYSTAIQLNPSDGTYYSKRGNVKMTMGNRNGACLDWTIAGKLGYYADFDKIKTICEQTIIKNR